MVAGGSLGRELLELAHRIEGEARSAGLDSHEVIFEMLDAKDVNAVAAYGGFPLRYPSWRFGMEFERLQKGYQYGLSKIYELVINNDPTIAYLVRSNSLMEQKLVMAHVFGHADFFKHNVWFTPTDRSMVDVMGRHASRVRDMIDAQGQDRVERFLDVALSLDTLVESYLPHRERLGKARVREVAMARSERARLSFEAALDGVEAQSGPDRGANAVALPTYDVLGYLASAAPLEAWEADILRMVRTEAYYFAPQRMTKIMNEGWASYWHSRLLTAGILDPSEIVEFADCHSGATLTAPGQINPYKLGIELFRHAAASGRDVFFLRRVHNDVSFIDDLVDEEFAVRHQLFVYQKNSRTGRNEVADRDWRHIKEELLRSLTWAGLPQIELAAIEKGEELLLVHHHDGRDIKLDEAGELLRQIALLWKRPVNLLTLEEDQGRRLSSDGQEVRVVESSQAESACKAPGKAA
jgi:stage V sporulation protein R